MIVDRGPQIFRIATCPTSVPTCPNVFSARLACHIGQHQTAPEHGKANDTTLELALIARKLRATVIEVDREHVSHVYRFYVPLLPVWFLLRRDVCGETLFGAFSLVRSASRGDMPLSVKDDPCRLPVRAVRPLASFAEPEAGSFEGSWHRCFISSIASKVVKSLPAIRIRASRPRLASCRNPVAVIVPPGKASAAPALRRSGASEATPSLPATTLPDSLVGRPAPAIPTKADVAHV